MCPGVSDELIPEMPYEAEHTVEVLGEEVRVCKVCKQDLEKTQLGVKL